MDAATSCDTTVDFVHVSIPLSAQETILADLEDRMSKATKRLLDEDEQGGRIPMGPIRIHRFPQGLRGIGGGDDRYVVPSVVAIGPYHHGRPHLQEMEVVKHAAADRFCSRSGCQLEKVYTKIASISDMARFCYAPGDGALARFSDDQFATMMFVDGCFLLEFIDSRFLGSQYSSRPGILRDIFLLENQIPWLVLEALMEFVPNINICRFVADMGEKYFFPKKEKKYQLCEEDQFTEESDPGGDMPPHLHLLGLLWFNQIRSMLDPKLRYDDMSSSSSSLSISAAELAQVGLKLTASKASRFGDMRVKAKTFYGELSLSPVFLNDVSACWLVNMAALEARMNAGSWENSDDRAAISSYMSVLAMLMDRKEDVHKLRRRGVLRSIFSNTQTLAFFKGLGRRLEPGHRFFITMNEIDRYMTKRTVRIAVHRFVYNNYRTVAKVLSITGVLFAVFKALLQINPHPHN
ncbi:hypothetical protein EJB05_58065, partial [Eragrostis curvula]